MELLFVALIGAIIGAVARYTLPGRHSHGATLVPAIGMAAAVTVWSALTWLGLPFNGGWIWVVSLLAAVGSAVAAGVLLPRRRAESDARLLSSLSKASSAR